MQTPPSDGTWPSFKSNSHIWLGVRICLGNYPEVWFYLFHLINFVWFDLICLIWFILLCFCVFDKIQKHSQKTSTSVYLACFKNYINKWVWILSRVSPCCSVTQSGPNLCDPVDCSTPGFPVLHHLPEFAQTHVHWVGDAIQLSHPLLLPSPSAFNLSQHQGLFKWVSSSHQMAKVLKLQWQHQSFQWIFGFDFL